MDQKAASDETKEQEKNEADAKAQNKANDPPQQQSQNLTQQQGQQQNQKQNQNENQQQPPVQMSGGRGGGQPPKGERRLTGKPDKPGKGVRRLPDGRWEVKDPVTGKKIIKPADWSPDTAKKVGIGAAILGTLVYIIHIAIETAPEWLPALAL